MNTYYTPMMMPQQTLPPPPISVGEAFQRRREAYPLTSRAAIRALDALRRALLGQMPAEALLSEVTQEHVRSVLQPLENPTTWNNRLRQLRAFFSWCIREGLLLRSPVVGFQAHVVPYHEPETFSEAQVERIFALASREATPAGVGITLTLGFFCGLRSAEIQRAVMEEINVSEGTVRVSIPKGFYRGIPPRLVQPPRNALLWLRYFLGTQPRGARELVAASAQEFAAWKKSVLAPVGLSWGTTEHRNVMRHTACSMHVAAFRNLAETQLFLGHSRGSDVTTRHYLGLISQREAERYWHIYPPAEPREGGEGVRRRRASGEDPRFIVVEVPAPLT